MKYLWNAVFPSIRSAMGWKKGNDSNLETTSMLIKVDTRWKVFKARAHYKHCFNIIYFPEVIRNHLLPNVICSSILEGRLLTLNALNKYLNVTRSEDDKLFVEDAQLLETDIMATNGVIHVIDDVLIPEEGRQYDLTVYFHHRALTVF